MLKKENYKIFVRPKKNKNYLVIVLIGKKITNEWEKYSKLSKRPLLECFPSSDLMKTWKKFLFN